MEGHASSQLGRNFFLYALTYLLLLEWLMPLPDITDTGYINVFMVFTAFFFLITFFQFPLWISFPIKVIVIFYGIHLIFFDIPFLSTLWWQFLLAEINNNIMLMISGYWMELTHLFRSFLFFVLLAMMSYVLFYWTVHAKRILFFLFFTIIYVAILDTFTVYDATFSIIRIFVIGFLLLGLLKMYRLMEDSRVKFTVKYLTLRYSFLVIFIILFAAISGIIAPKLEPQWSDPVPFIQTALGVEGDGVGIGGATRQIGYSMNDERLGGGFTMNDDPVFYAISSKPQYWRGESKDFYSGRGWEVTTPSLTNSQSFLYEQLVEKEQLEVEITMVSNRTYEQLFYPGELLGTSTFGTDVTTNVDFYTGKAIPNYAFPLEEFNIMYESPSFPIQTLRNVSEEDPEEIKEYYLQLPDDLPTRISELANEIVRNDSNRYDKVKRIENYFSLAGYRYETTNVPFPEYGQDYVDQFLFETKQGYCDNFSTSMVVLLRTLDIPARWVKGFTQGDRIETLEDGRHLYEITNANAHSWVEVYFPEVGWVPFEPTRGYNHAFDFTFDTDVQLDQEVPQEDVVVNEPEIEETLAELNDEVIQAQEETSHRPVYFFIIFISALLLLAIYVIIKRKLILSKIIINRYRTRNDEEAFVEAYQRLIWFLRFYGYGKKEQETLREYAIRVDRLFSTDVMQKLTINYEKVFYGRASGKVEWEKSRKLWENLIKKIGS